VGRGFGGLGHGRGFSGFSGGEEVEGWKPFFARLRSFGHRSIPAEALATPQTRFRRRT
jgi:hypothetical protein